MALDGPQAREALARTLWPKVGAATATANLCQRIARLRRDTGHRLVRTGAFLRLAEGVSVDAWTISAMNAEQLLEPGDLLAGCEYRDMKLLDAWVADQRERCRRSRADALAGHAAALEQAGRLAAALALNEQILALAPLQEHAWRRHMRLHYLRGDRIATIEAFERFEALLRAQTGGRPGEETCDLLRTIEHAEPAPPIKRAVLPASPAAPPVLAGRARERDEMTRAWEAGRAFVLSADAGMGKTRLLEDYPHGREGAVIEQGRPGDSQTPYAVLARRLHAVLEHHAAPLDEFTRRELARILPGIGPASLVPAQQAVLWAAVEKLLAQACASGLRRRAKIT